jgi:hypothetical protein
MCPTLQAGVAANLTDMQATTSLSSSPPGHMYTRLYGDHAMRVAFEFAILQERRSIGGRGQLPSIDTC